MKSFCVKKTNMLNLKPELDRKLSVHCMGCKLGKRQPSIVTIRPWYPVFSQCARLMAPSLPTFSSDQVRAILLHHRFSCCHYSSAGSILLIHMTKRQTAHTVLVHSKLSSTRLPPVILLKQDASLVLIALTPFLHQSFFSSCPSTLSLYIPVSSLWLPVLCIFSGRI